MYSAPATNRATGVRAKAAKKTQQAVAPHAASPIAPPVRVERLYRVTGRGRLRGQSLVTIDYVRAVSGKAGCRAVEDREHHANRTWDAEFIAKRCRAVPPTGPVYHVLGGRHVVGVPPAACALGGECGCEECRGTCVDEDGGPCEDCVCGASGCCEWCAVCLVVHR